jgi:hypothetical protein
MSNSDRQGGNDREEIETGLIAFILRRVNEGCHLRDFQEQGIAGTTEDNLATSCPWTPWLLAQLRGRPLGQRAAQGQYSSYIVPLIR